MAEKLKREQRKYENKSLECKDRVEEAERDGVRGNRLTHLHNNLHHYHNKIRSWRHDRDDNEAQWQRFGRFTYEEDTRYWKEGDRYRKTHWF